MELAGRVVINSLCECYERLCRTEGLMRAVLVIGTGYTGTETALVSARMGVDTVMRLNFYFASLV